MKDTVKRKWRAGGRIRRKGESKKESGGREKVKGVINKGSKNEMRDPIVKRKRGG